MLLIYLTIIVPIILFTLCRCGDGSWNRPINKKGNRRHSHNFIKETHAHAFRSHAIHIKNMCNIMAVMYAYPAIICWLVFVSRIHPKRRWWTHFRFMFHIGSTLWFLLVPSLFARRSSVLVPWGGRGCIHQSSRPIKEFSGRLFEQKIRNLLRHYSDKDDNSLSLRWLWVTFCCIYRGLDWDGTPNWFVIGRGTTLVLNSDDRSSINNNFDNNIFVGRRMDWTRGEWIPGIISIIYWAAAARVEFWFQGGYPDHHRNPLECPILILVLLRRALQS